LGLGSKDLVPVLTRLADLETRDKHYPAARAVLGRIVRIEREAVGAVHETVTAPRKKRREVAQLSGDTAEVARLEKQMQPPPATQRGGLPGPADAKNRRYKMDQGFATVRIFYGTNRAPSGDLKPAAYYGPARGELQYGWLDVTIPESHKEAELETQP